MWLVQRNKKFVKHYPIGYKQSILSQLLQFINKNFEDAIQTTIDDIAMAHADATNNTKGFRYQNKVYSHSTNKEQSYKFVALSHELVHDFRIHLRNWENNRRRMAAIESALHSALNLMGNITDLYNLLPDCLHPILPKRDTEMSSLKDKDVRTYLSDYADELKLIKTQLIIKAIKE